MDGLEDKQVETEDAASTGAAAIGGVGVAASSMTATSTAAAASSSAGASTGDAINVASSTDEEPEPEPDPMRRVRFEADSHLDPAVVLRAEAEHARAAVVGREVAWAKAHLAALVPKGAPLTASPLAPFTFRSARIAVPLIKAAPHAANRVDRPVQVLLPLPLASTRPRGRAAAWRRGGGGAAPAQGGRRGSPHVAPP